MADLRLRVTATFTHPAIQGQPPHTWVKADLSHLVQENPVLSSFKVGRRGTLKQTIVCECMHLLCAEPVVVYKDPRPVDFDVLPLDMLWQACCVETRDRQPYFTWEIGHNDPNGLDGCHIEHEGEIYSTEKTPVYEVRAGHDPVDLAYEHEYKGWFVHLKAEAFHHRDHDLWCRRVEQRRA